MLGVSKNNEFYFQVMLTGKLYKITYFYETITHEGRSFYGDGRKDEDI